MARERAPAKEGGTGGTLVAEPGQDRDEHETRLVYDSSNSGGPCTDTVIRYASENESDTGKLREDLYLNKCSNVWLFVKCR